MRENGRHASTGTAHSPMKKRPQSLPPQGSRRTGGVVRVIGGRWRGTRLPVADLEGLRPTPDRVRETLFNWLAPALPGARVLDLFAGTGALGLESVSRGAAAAVLVERDPGQAATLRQLSGRLPGAEAVQVVQADALHWLTTPAPASFDIAFLDPPFGSGAWQAALAGVLPLMAPGGWIYVEGPTGLDLRLPMPWQPYRDGRTRDTHFALHRHPGAGAKGGPAIATLHSGPDTPPEAPSET